MSKTKKQIEYFSKKTKESIKNYFKKIFEIIKRPETAILPGQLAFYMILSAVPIITLCIYGLSFFGITPDSMYDLLNKTIPGGAELFRPLLTGTDIDFALILIFIWMFYIASNGFNSLILVANNIYGIKSSNWIKRRIKAMFMTFTFVLMLIVILLVPVFGQKILTFILKGEVTEKVMTIYGYVKGPISWLVMLIFIRTIYEFAPDRIRSKNHVNAGALFTSVGWIIITLIYSHSANNMTKYNLLYGTLSSISFLMIWLNFMSYIFVLGMTLNYGEELDKKNLESPLTIEVIKD